MKFTMNRDRTVTSTNGHVIHFKKDEPTHVPPSMYAEVQSKGAVPEDEIPENEQPKAPAFPTDPAARKQALFGAFEKIVLRNVREEFTAGGAPHASVLAKELGWQTSPKERDTAWVEFKAGADRDD